MTAADIRIVKTDITVNNTQSSIERNTRCSLCLDTPSFVLRIQTRVESGVYVHTDICAACLGRQRARITREVGRDAKFADEQGGGLP